jgi:hypothetical protein
MPYSARRRLLSPTFKSALLLGLLSLIASSSIYTNRSSIKHIGDTANSGINGVDNHHQPHHRRLFAAADKDDDDKDNENTENKRWGVEKQDVNTILGLGTGRPPAPSTVKMEGTVNPLLFPRPAHSFKGKSPLLFTCPDGRKGLHVVHTRLMLNMITARGAKGTFRAGRMLLFRDFSLASLARQSVQNFVYYVSYDFSQDFPFLESCLDILKYRMIHGASFLYLPEKGFSYTLKAHLMLDFTRVQGLLLEHDLATEEELSEVQLYITTRLDSDDAGNIDSVRLTQKQACSSVGPKHKDRILLTYIEPKLFWLPDAKQPFGQLATIPKEGVSEAENWRNIRAMRYRPVMQSLTIDKTLLKCTTPINCYSHQHFQPSYIIFARNDSDCPFEFEWQRNYYLIKPENDAIGGLYSRSPSSWYAAVNNRGYHFLNFSNKALSDCGVVPSELASTNLMLAMLYKDAPDAAAMSADAARGFGGIGAFATWKKKKEVLKAKDPAYMEVFNSLNSTLTALFKGAVRSYMYGSRWKYGQEINYKKIAEEVKRNFTRFGVEYFLNDEEWYAEELAE